MASAKRPSVDLDPDVNAAYKRAMGQVVKLKRGELRDALLEYAMNAVEQGTIEVMSLRQAARDLGVSSGAVYRHFADKESLLHEVTMVGFMDLKARFRAIRPEDAPATSLEQVVGRLHKINETYVKFALERTAMWHMMFGRIGAACRDKLMQDPELSHYTPFDVVLACLQELHAFGGTRETLSEADVRYCWSAVHGAADLAQSGARLDADQIDQVIEDTHRRNLRAIGYEGSF